MIFYIVIAVVFSAFIADYTTFEICACIKFSDYTPLFYGSHCVDFGCDAPKWRLCCPVMTCSKKQHTHFTERH